MSKLEKAILKSTGEIVEGHNLFISHRSAMSSAEEIVNMKYSFYLNSKDMRSKKTVYPSMKNKKLVNSFRKLRTSLIADDVKNVIMVTSVCENAGVSFFARNIAAASAFDTSKTSVLLDCNIENNDVSELFDLNKKSGIINYLFDLNLNVEDIIHESGISRFRVVPFGAKDKNVGEHFSHPRFKLLVNQLKERFKDRCVYIDAPPITESADSRILMQLCDQVVLVAPYGKILPEKLEEAVNIIGQEKFSGVVFNNYAT